MTATECLHAIHHAMWAICTLQGLSVWRKLQIAMLKMVAISGYHYGKYIALQDRQLKDHSTAASKEDADRDCAMIRQGLCLLTVIVPGK